MDGSYRCMHAIDFECFKGSTPFSFLWTEFSPRVAITAPRSNAKNTDLTKSFWVSHTIRLQCTVPYSILVNCSSLTKLGVPPTGRCASLGILHVKIWTDNLKEKPEWAKTQWKTSWHQHAHNFIQNDCPKLLSRSDCGGLQATNCIPNIQFRSRCHRSGQTCVRFTSVRTQQRPTKAKRRIHRPIDGIHRNCSEKWIWLLGLLV